MMMYTTESNGYKASGLQDNIRKFNEMCKKLLGDAIVEHFYYGDFLDMVTVRIACSDSYGHFNISKNRISFNGHTCTTEEYNLFTHLTMNDELYNGWIK